MGHVNSSADGGGSGSVLYAALYMASIRTQVYLTEEQRAKVERLRARDGRTLAEVVRTALDEYLAGQEQPDMRAAFAATFGAVPDLEVPSRDEWDRGYG